MAADALLASARSRRPVGLRHMDLRLATASAAALAARAPPLPHRAPARPPPASAPPARRAGRSRSRAPPAGRVAGGRLTRLPRPFGGRVHPGSQGRPDGGSG